LSAENVSIFTQVGINMSGLGDSLNKKVVNRRESTAISAWMSRLNVVAALRLLREDLDLVSRADVFRMVSVRDQLNEKNSESNTALHIAAEGNNDSAVRRLLAWRADVTILNNNQKLPIDLAQDSCSDLLARMVSMRGENSSPPSNQGDVLENGWTALMVAAEIEDSDSEQIDALLRHENNINATNSIQQTALHIAASAGNAEVVTLLVERKADLEIRDENQYTALCIAAEKGNTDSVRNLIEARADLTVMCKEETTAKFLSVLDLASGNECIELLKRYGVDGWTPLMVAVERGRYSVKLFLDTKENLVRLHDGRPLLGSFQQALRMYSNLVCLQNTWKWGNHEADNLVLSDDGCKVSKVRDNPDYSCVLGGIIFQTGVHRWTLKATDVSYMWAGVARRVTEAQLRTCPGGIQSGDGCCIAFGCSPSDVRLFGDNSTETTFYAQSGYTDDQILDFELDMFAGSLKFSVDGVLAAVVSNLDGRELQPYVCMDYSESVELLANTSFTADERLLSRFEYTLAGASNVDYSKEFDAELLRYSPKAPDAEKIDALQHTFGGEIALFRDTFRVAHIRTDILVKIQGHF
jgi:ankyrin repeat protein